ncbi:hypothetical protein ABBQ32_002674 [Trebouxia sp. C0010 RCD-2024]
MPIVKASEYAWSFEVLAGTPASCLPRPPCQLRPLLATVGRRNIWLRANRTLVRDRRLCAAAVRHLGCGHLAHDQLRVCEGRPLAFVIAHCPRSASDSQDRGGCVTSKVGSKHSSLSDFDRLPQQHWELAKQHSQACCLGLLAAVHIVSSVQSTRNQQGKVCRTWTCHMR